MDGDRNAAGLGLGCRWERVRCSRLGSGCGQFGVRMQLGWDQNGTRSDGDSDADGSGIEHGWVRDGMRTRADGDGDAAGARSGRSRLLRVRAAWGEDAAGMGPRWAGVGPGEGEGGSRCGDVPTCAPGTNATRTLVQSKVPRTEPPAPRCRTPRAASRTTSPTGRDGMARDPQHGRVGAPHSAPPPTWQHGEGREAAARRAHGGGLCPQSPARTPPRPAELRTALPGGGGAGGGAAAEPVWGTRVRWGYGSPHPIRGARCSVRCCGFLSPIGMYGAGGNPMSPMWDGCWGCAVPPPLPTRPPGYIALDGVDCRFLSPIRLYGVGGCSSSLPMRLYGAGGRYTAP